MASACVVQSLGTEICTVDGVASYWDDSEPVKGEAPTKGVPLCVWPNNTRPVRYLRDFADTDVDVAEKLAEPGGCKSEAYFRGVFYDAFDCVMQAPHFFAHVLMPDLVKQSKPRRSKARAVLYAAVVALAELEQRPETRDAALAICSLLTHLVKQDEVQWLEEMPILAQPPRKLEALHLVYVATSALERIPRSSKKLRKHLFAAFAAPLLYSNMRCALGVDVQAELLGHAIPLFKRWPSTGMFHGLTQTLLMVGEGRLLRKLLIPFSRGPFEVYAVARSACTLARAGRIRGRHEPLLFADVLAFCQAHFWDHLQHPLVWGSMRVLVEAYGLDVNELVLMLLQTVRQRDGRRVLDPNHAEALARMIMRFIPLRVHVLWGYMGKVDPLYREIVRNLVRMHMERQEAPELPETVQGLVALSRVRSLPELLQSACSEVGWP